MYYTRTQHICFFFTDVVYYKLKKGEQHYDQKEEITYTAYSINRVLDGGYILFF